MVHNLKKPRYLLGYRARVQINQFYKSWYISTYIIWLIYSYRQYYCLNKPQPMCRLFCKLEIIGCGKVKPRWQSCGEFSVCVHNESEKTYRTLWVAGYNIIVASYICMYFKRHYFTLECLVEICSEKAKFLIGCQFLVLIWAIIFLVRSKYYCQRPWNIIKINFTLSILQYPNITSVSFCSFVILLRKLDIATV